MPVKVGAMGRRHAAITAAMTHCEVGQLVLQGVVQLTESGVALGLVVARQDHVRLCCSHKLHSLHVVIPPAQ